GVAAEPLEPRAPRGERARDGLLTRAREARLADETAIQLRRAVERVEARERVVERLGPEEDCERVGLALLVQHPQARPERRLGGGDVVASDAEPLRREDAFAADRLGLGSQRIEPRVRPREPAVERVEAKERRVRLRRKGGVLGAEVVSVLQERGRGGGGAGARQRD